MSVFPSPMLYHVGLIVELLFFHVKIRWLKNAQRVYNNIFSMNVDTCSYKFHNLHDILLQNSNLGFNGTQMDFITFRHKHSRIRWNLQLALYHQPNLQNRTYTVLNSLVNSDCANNGLLATETANSPTSLIVAHRRTVKLKVKYLK